MSNKRTIVFLLLSCVLSMRTVIAQESPAHVPEEQASNELLSGIFAYLSPEAQSAFVMLEKALPDHAWSLVFKNLCKDIHHDGNLAPYESMVCNLNECLAVHAQHEGNAQLDGIASEIQGYTKLLTSGDVCISAKDAMSIINDDEQAVTRGCCKFCPTKPTKFLNLCGTLLTTRFVSAGELLVNGVNFTTLQGVAGAAGAAGATGAGGAAGAAGAQGPIGLGGVLGAAEFVHLIQSPNNSRGVGVPFAIDTQVYNNVPAVIVATTPDGTSGTYFTLSTAGTYVLDYEMSLTNSGSVALWKGAAVSGPLLIDPNTIAGSEVGTTWIHGRAFVTVAGTPVVVAIAPAFANDAVTTAGDYAGIYMVRLTILKISAT